MQKKTNRFPVFGLLVQMALICAIWQSSVQAAEVVYPSMAPVSQYMMSGKAEIMLARSAAPPSISADATVMILGRSGYSIAAKGNNGFLCLVERSWGSTTTDPEFWNPQVRGPICFNPTAARTFAPIYLMKTRLVLTGKSREEIIRSLASAFNNGELPALESGAMCYMMSRQQYLGDQAGKWHPHLMFFSPLAAGKDWGSNLPGSPVIATKDPEGRATIFMVRVGHWSDGALASPTIR